MADAKFSNERNIPVMNVNSYDINANTADVIGPFSNRRRKLSLAMTSTCTAHQCHKYTATAECI